MKHFFATSDHERPEVFVRHLVSGLASGFQASPGPRVSRLARDTNSRRFGRLPRAKDLGSSLELKRGRSSGESLGVTTPC